MRPAVIATLGALVGVTPTRFNLLPAPAPFRGNAAARGGAFEGAWREVQVQVTLRNGKVILIHPEASLFVATKAHYSKMATSGDPPRPVFKTLDPTCAELAKAYQTFWGNTGRYEMAGDTLTFYPIVARDPNLMGGIERVHVRASRDTLWLTGKTDDIYYRQDGRLVPDTTASYIAVETILVRVAE